MALGNCKWLLEKLSYAATDKPSAIKHTLVHLKKSWTKIDGTDYDDIAKALAMHTGEFQNSPYYTSPETICTYNKTRCCRYTCLPSTGAKLYPNNYGSDLVPKSHLRLIDQRVSEKNGSKELQEAIRKLIETAPNKQEAVRLILFNVNSRGAKIDGTDYEAMARALAHFQKIFNKHLITYSQLEQKGK